MPHGQLLLLLQSLLTLPGGRSSSMGMRIIQSVYDQVLDRKAHPKGRFLHQYAAEQGRGLKSAEGGRRGCRGVDRRPEPQP